jgi:epoxyqueuosine reductase
MFGVILQDAVKQRAHEIGFDLVGIAPITANSDLEFSRSWVECGYGGDMHYLRNPKRDDPRRVLPSVKSVVCVGLVYNTPLPYSTEVSRGGPSRLSRPLKREHHEGAPLPSHVPTAWISRYAWGRDYHPVMRKKLEMLRTAIEAWAPGSETRVYVDTGPIVERAFARLSGIGWAGKNTCLINETKGSWFFIGVVLTSLELAPDQPAPDRCGSCTACLDACPTGALIEPYVMDASRCISYFTIELKGPIPVEFRSAVGANVFGCDICQDVCPWNGAGRDQAPRVRSREENQRPPTVNRLPKKATPQASEITSQGEQAVTSHRSINTATTDLAEFQPLRLNLTPGNRHPAPTADPQPLAPDPRPPTLSLSLFNPTLDQLALLTAEDFRQLFSRSPIKRAKYRGWLRNLCVAMGNSGERRFLPWLKRAGENPDPIIREHAEWALGKMGYRE